MKIKGVIFDFNGTLFWDTELHYHAWNIFIEKYGIVMDENEKEELIIGRNNEYILDRIFPDKLPREEITKLSIEKENIYQEICLEQKLQLADGSISLFGFLKKNYIPFTIATGSDLHNVEFYFKYLELDRYFDKSKVIYSDGTIKSKPNPEAFRRALNVLGINPEEAMIFEDSAPGIKAAENLNAGKIIIVNSTDKDFSKWNYPVIKNFSEVDRRIFINT
jgi:beta-phosphoglucomutase-like phosphatase (HAD superfamily)